jgi:hypothetical protein
MTTTKCSTNRSLLQENHKIVALKGSVSVCISVVSRYYSDNHQTSFLNSRGEFRWFINTTSWYYLVHN